MIRIASIAAIMAGPVAAQNHPMTFTGTDTIEMEQTAADRAEVIYHNAADQRSASQVVTLTAGDIVVRVTITAVPSAPERIVIEPQGDYVAIPPEMLVVDGETATILVVRPLF